MYFLENDWFILTVDADISKDRCFFLEDDWVNLTVDIIKQLQYLHLHMIDQNFVSMF